MIMLKKYTFIFLFILLIVLPINFTSAKIFYEDGSYYLETELHEQWNLIAGISFSENLHSSSQLTKDAIFSSYYYDAKTKSNVKIRPDYEAGGVDPLTLYSNAFWVFSAKPGKIVYKVSPSFVNKSRLGGYYPFYTGENLIAINDEMYGKTLAELKGNCTIIKASIWDAETQKWVGLGLEQRLDFGTRDSFTGRGINLRVADDCGFMSGSGSFNGIVSIATLKDSYLIGETILLTDPPDVNNNQANNPLTGNAISNPDRMERQATDQTMFVGGDNEASANNLDSLGYIIQFDNPSLSEKKQELEKKAENNENFIKNHPILSTVTTYRFFSLRNSDVVSKIEAHKNNLQAEHQNFKDSFNKLKSNGVVGGESQKSEMISAEYENAFNGIALEASLEEIEQIKKIGEVKKIWLDNKVELSLMDSVPLIQDGTLAGRLDRGGNDCTISGKECLTGEGVKVGIIDTGIDYTHEDLGNCDYNNFLIGNCSKVIGGYDFSDNDDDPMDYYGHGTHVAATVAGKGVLNGVAPDADLYSLKVFPNSYASVIIEAIEWSLDPNQDGNYSDHLDVISLSLGGDGNPDDPMSQSIDNAVGQGIVAVIAAGNSGPSEQTIGSPGTARRAITVGATTKQDNMAYFSSRGPVIWEDEEENLNYLMKPDIVAPGVNICAAQWGSAWDSNKCEGLVDEEHIQISGTSMATPHISGVVALIKQAHPNWNPEEIKSVLKSTAKNINENLVVQGAGRVDVFQAITSNKLPIARLSAKVQDNTLKFFGTAYSPNFSYFKIYESYDEEDYNEIYSSSSSTVEDYLYELDVRDLKDGRIIFKLETTSLEGYTNSDFVQVKIENIKLKGLLSSDIYRKGDNILIRADILYPDYSYNISWSRQSEYSWSSEGINLIDDGDIIANWDTGFLGSTGFYKIKITFYAPNIGIFEKNIENIYFDSSLKEGWPVHLDWYYDPNYWDSLNENKDYGYMNKNSESILFSRFEAGLNNPLSQIQTNDLAGNLSLLNKYGTSSTGVYYFGGMFEPAIYDLDNDGKKEIIVFKGGNPPKIIAYYSNGSIYFEKDLGFGDAAGGNLHIPLIGDINNDGFGEIIAYNAMDSTLYSFNYLGDLSWSLELSSGSFSQTMLMADLNNDGDKEIVFQSNDAFYPKIHIIDNDGKLINEWAIPDNSWGASIVSSPAIGNFDDDSDLEIVSAGPAPSAGGVWSEDGNFLGWNNEGVIHVYNLDGSIVEGWPRYTDGVIFSSPVVGDINKDNQDDIIIGLFYASEIFPDINYGGVYAFNRDGTIMDGWPYEKGYNFWASPALGDVNKDGTLEIATSKLGFVTSLLNISGGVMDGWPRYTAWNSYYSTIMGDINNDNSLDILTTAGGIYSCPSNCGGVYAWNKDGDLIDGFPKVTEIDAQAPAVIDDIDNDGKLELIASSDWDADVYGGSSKHRGSIYVWELDGDYNLSNLPWPQFQHDAQHTGKYGLEISRPQSKIVNLENSNVAGTLLIKIQNYSSGSWTDYITAYNQNITILPLQVIKLDSIFNPLGVSLSRAGNYRVIVSFKDKESSFMFRVV